MTRIGTRVEKLRQGAHLCCTAHRLGDSSSERCRQIGCRQYGAGPLAKPARQNSLGRVGRGSVAALAAAVSAGCINEDARGGALDGAGRARPQIGRCWPAGPPARTAADSSSQASGPARQSSMRLRGIPAVPAAPGASRHVPQRLANLRKRPGGSATPASLLEACDLIRPCPSHQDILDHNHPAPIPSSTACPIYGPAAGIFSSGSAAFIGQAPGHRTDSSCDNIVTLTNVSH